MDAAHNDLRGRHAGSMVKLELGHETGLDLRLAGVNALPFREAKLVSHIGREIAEGRQHDGKFRS